MNTPVREGETIEGRGPVPCGIDPIQCSSAQVRLLAPGDKNSDRQGSSVDSPYLVIHHPTHNSFLTNVLFLFSYYRLERQGSDFLRGTFKETRLLTAAACRREQMRFRARGCAFM